MLLLKSEYISFLKLNILCLKYKMCVLVLKILHVWFVFGKDCFANECYIVTTTNHISVSLKWTVNGFDYKWALKRSFTNCTG